MGGLFLPSIVDMLFKILNNFLMDIYTYTHERLQGTENLYTRDFIYNELKDPDAPNNYKKKQKLSTKNMYTLDFR